MPENIVIVGATSGIAKALCAELASGGANLVLAGRNVEELDREAADLRVRFQRDVFVEPFDAADVEHFAEFWANSVGHFPDGVTGMVVCYGLLPVQVEAQRDGAVLRQSFDVNFASPAALMEV